MALYRCVSSGGGVTPTSITPTMTPQSVSEDGIYQISDDDGYIVKKIYDVAPSNTSPSGVTNGGNYHIIGQNGVLINNYAFVVPSDSSPAVVAYGAIVKNTSNNTTGYLYETQAASKTPSDSSPASVSANSIIQPSANGYLFATNNNAGITNVDGKSIFGYAIVTTSSSSGNYTAIPRFYKGMTVNSNNYFVIQTAGTYQIYCAGNGGSNYVRLSINGGTATTGWRIDTTKTLAVGDTVRCYCAGGSNGGGAAIYLYKT